MAEQPPAAPSANSNPARVSLESSVKKLKCGISWDFFDKAVDLDVTVVALDSYSLEMDAAFFNKPSILDGTIVHSGDNKTGVGDGDDEAITIDVDKLPKRCSSLWFIVNAFAGGDFSDVESARFTLYDATNDNKSIYSYGIGMAFNSSAMLIGVLSADDAYAEHKRWTFQIVEKKGAGHNFVESKPLLLESLGLVYEEGILMERPSDRNQMYNLEKGDSYVIDPEIKKVTVGLGWDEARSAKGDSIDVDASVIVFEAKQREFKTTTIVNYNQLKFGDAVVHHGDNLTGAGKGDDERIDMDLAVLDVVDKTDVLAVVINIYAGATSFADIRNCFARLVDEEDSELCRFTLSEEYDSQAMVMCHVEKKTNGCWAMVTHGEGCTGTTAGESMADVARVLGGTLQSGGYDAHAPPTGNDNSCCVVL